MIHGCRRVSGLRRGIGLSVVPFQSVQKMSRSPLPTEVLHFIEPQRSCSYIPTERAALEYRMFPTLSASELDHLISRGWRRFGVHVFRPACSACRQCVPIRVDVKKFRPSKGQRKTQRRNQHVRVSLHHPSVTREHLRLYNAWHEDMTARRNWPLQQSSPSEYAEGFLSGDFPSGRELRYFDGEELIGVGLIDQLPQALSSAYFYHAPSWRPWGPGTFSLLCEIELARRLDLDYVYLGYWIGACASMSYKNRFVPYEILTGRPADDESPHWTRPAAE